MEKITLIMFFRTMFIKMALHIKIQRFSNLKKMVWHKEWIEPSWIWYDQWCFSIISNWCFGVMQWYLQAIWEIEVELMLLKTRLYMKCGMASSIRWGISWFLVPLVMTWYQRNKETNMVLEVKNSFYWVIQTPPRHIFFVLR